MIIALLLAAVQPTPAHIETARATLESQLSDYEGSRLRGFIAVRTPGDVLTLCGEINARGPGGGMTGWRKAGIVVEGDPVGPSVIAVSRDGYTGLSRLAKVCPIVGPTATITPPGAVIGDADITASLQPVALEAVR